MEITARADSVFITFPCKWQKHVCSHKILQNSAPHPQMQTKVKNTYSRRSGYGHPTEQLPIPKPPFPHLPITSFNPTTLAKSKNKPYIRTRITNKPRQHEAWTCIYRLRPLRQAAHASIRAAHHSPVRQSVHSRSSRDTPARHRRATHCA